MVIDITIYKDRAHVRFIYSHGDASRWIEYPEGTKEKALKLIHEWYYIYENYLKTKNITLHVHDNDYFSYQHGQSHI